MLPVLSSFESLLKLRFIVVFFSLVLLFTGESRCLSFHFYFFSCQLFVFFAHFYIELFTLNLSEQKLFKTYLALAYMCFSHSKPQINFLKNRIMLSYTECLQNRSTQGMVLFCGSKHCPHLQTQKYRLTFLLVFSIFSFTFRHFHVCFLPNQKLFECV